LAVVLSSVVSVSVSAMVAPVSMEPVNVCAEDALPEQPQSILESTSASALLNTLHLQAPVALEVESLSLEWVLPVWSTQSTLVVRPSIPLMPTVNVSRMEECAIALQESVHAITALPRGGQCSMPLLQSPVVPPLLAAA